MVYLCRVKRSSNKRSRKRCDRRTGRNIRIGIALFLLLAVAGWQYYRYCMAHEISSAALNSREVTTVAEKSVHRDVPEKGEQTTDSGAGDSTGSCTLSETVQGSQQGGDFGENASSLHIDHLELPFTDAEEFLIRNEEGRYTILYDTLYRQAAWVAYLLTGSDVHSGGVKRKDRFAVDPRLLEMKFPAATPSDYKGTGYDRGHLCPSADRTASQSENDCTFYMSNIAPQTPALNRGPWKQLEEQVRKWAIRYDSVYVVAGGVLTEGLETIGHGIGVPELFYKAVLTRSEGEFHAVGFVIPNENRFQGEYRDYAVPVDSLETLTSIDFFHNLPDEEESEVESACSLEFWFD